jgi:Zn-dependent M28 family amino/carboxypeptidase
MEVAEAFASSKTRPKRSILFLTFSAEEKGLYGSRHFTNEPLFPIENIVAMLNMDMISRNDSNEVAVIGTPSSSDLKAVIEKANESVGMSLAYDQERYFLQSDHYPFYRKGIPVLSFNTKDTPDLHRPTDDPEKTNPEKMARIGRIVFATAWMVANRAERPGFTKFR